MGSKSTPETNRSKPSSLLRIAFRLPIHLYEHRLGWLTGGCIGSVSCARPARGGEAGT